MGLTALDWIVVAVYFLAITLLGLWTARSVRTTRGYFLGDRRLPWWVMVGQSFGTGTNAENPVAQAGTSFAGGFATIWYQWKNMLITPFYWLLAPWYRRCRRTTIGEIIDDRYGRGLALLYTVFAIAYFVFNQGAMLKGAGKIIAVAAGGQQMVSADPWGEMLRLEHYARLFTGSQAPTANDVVLLMAAAFILYSFFGGLLASAYTDFVQSFLIIGLSFMLIPAGLAAVGGFRGLHQTLPASFFDVFNENSGVDAFAIAMLALNGLVGITAQPHMLSMYATGRSELGGRIGHTYGSIVKRFCTIGWALTGLIVAAIVVQQGLSLGHDREAAFGFACRHLLGPGLTGLMVACVLAANMSTCSNFMVNTGALFTRNLYHDFFRPQAGDRELLWAGRLSGLALAVLGVVFGLLVTHVLDAFLFTETIAALMGIMFMGGFLWRRANRYGAAAATFSSFALYYALNYLLTCPGPAGPWKTLWPAVAHLAECWRSGTAGEFLRGGEHKLVYAWSGGAFGTAMLVGFVALLLVSVLTPAEQPARINRFFAAMREPGDDTSDGAPQSAAERGEELILLDLPGWFTHERWQNFFHRYRQDLLGFAVAWGSVVLMFAVAWGLMQIGR